MQAARLNKSGIVVKNHRSFSLMLSVGKSVDETRSLKAKRAQNTKKAGQITVKTSPEVEAKYQARNYDEITLNIGKPLLPDDDKCKKNRQIDKTLPSLSLEV